MSCAPLRKAMAMSALEAMEPKALKNPDAVPTYPAPPPHSAHSSLPPFDPPGSRSTDAPQVSAQARTSGRPRPCSAWGGGSGADGVVKAAGTRGSVSHTATRRRPGWEERRRRAYGPLV